MKSDRIIGLDIIRVIAITIVVIFHSAEILKPLNSLPVAGAFIHKLLALTEPFGLLGVELFFVLSGFLIGSILIKIFVRSEWYGFEEIRSFLIRRWFRTLPNFWLILIANYLLYTALHLNSFNADYFQYFLFVQNLWHRHPEFFPEAWSLAIEEWFYLTLPTVLLVIAWLFRNKSKKNKILFTFICYASVFFLLRVLCSDTQNTDPLYFDYGIRKIVMFRLDAISYGLLIAFLNTFYNEQLMKMRKTLLLISVSGIVIVTGVHYMGIHPHFNFYHRYAGYRFFHNTLFLTLIPLFFCLSIPFASGVREIKSGSLSMVISTISKISYSVYLTHFTLILLPMNALMHYTVSNCVPIYIIYIAVVFGLSYGLYRYFEVPMMNLRKSISKEEPKI